LTANEAMLLKAFNRAPSGRLETWQIAEMLNVELDETMRNSIKVRIARLRKKLLDVGAEGLVIESIRSIGYQLLVRVEVS
jgi:DNA-binding response OmpR family regulator